MLPRHGKARVRAAHWRAGITSNHLRVLTGDIDGQASAAQSPVMTSLLVAAGELLDCLSIEHIPKDVVSLDKLLRILTPAVLVKLTALRIAF